MFNRVDNAAKVAFQALVDHLKSKEFTLLDSQFLNPFTKQLGAVEIPSSEFIVLLEKAVLLPSRF